MISMDEKFTIVKANKVDLDVRKEMGEIFAEGFTQWLGYFSNDKSIIAKAFAHMFILDQFYVAIKTSEIAGVAACTDGKSLSVRLNIKELRSHLGFIKGSMAGIFLKKEFEAHYENFPPNNGSIEIVENDTTLRGQCVMNKFLVHSIQY